MMETDELEKKLELAFGRGLRKGASQRAKASINPIDPWQTETEEGFLELFGERLQQKLESMEERGFIDGEMGEAEFGGALSSESKHAMAAYLSKNSTIPRRWVVPLSIYYLVEGKFSWLSGVLLSREEAFEALLKKEWDNRFYSRVDEISERFIGQVEGDVMEAYERNFPSSCHNIRMLYKAVELGKASLCRALKLYEKAAEEGGELAGTASKGIKGFLELALPEEAGYILGLAKNMIAGRQGDMDYISDILAEIAKTCPEKSEEVMDAYRKMQAISPEYNLPFSLRVELPAKAIPVGKVESSLGLFNELISSKDVSTAEHASKSLGRVVEAASPEEIGGVIRLFDKCAERDEGKIVENMSAHLGKLAAKSPKEFYDGVAGLYEKCARMSDKAGGANLAETVAGQLPQLAMSTPPEKAESLFRVFGACLDLRVIKRELISRALPHAVRATTKKTLPKLVELCEKASLPGSPQYDGMGKEIDKRHFLSGLESLPLGSLEILAKNLGEDKVKFVSRVCRKAARKHYDAAIANAEKRVEEITGRATSENLGSVISLCKKFVSNGHTNPLNSIGRLVKAISDSEMGKWAKRYRMGQVFRMFSRSLKRGSVIAAGSLGQLAKSSPPERIGQVICLYKHASSSLDPAIPFSVSHSLEQLVGTAPKERAEEVIGIFENCMGNSQEESSKNAARMLGSLVRATTPEMVGRAAGLYKMCFKAGGDAAMWAIRNLKAITEEASPEQIDYVISLFDDCLSFTCFSKNPREDLELRKHVGRMGFAGNSSENFFEQMDRAYRQVLFKEEAKRAGEAAGMLGYLAAAVPKEKIGSVVGIYKRCMEKDSEEYRDIAVSELQKSIENPVSCEILTKKTIDDIGEWRSLSRVASRAAESLGRLANASPPENFDNVIRLYEMCLGDRKSAEVPAASQIGALLESAPPGKKSGVVRLWKRFLIRRGDTADTAASQLGSAAECAVMGKISLEECRELYEFAIRRRALEGASKSLPEMAQRFPKEALGLYRKAHKYAARSSRPITENEINVQLKLIGSIESELRKMLSEERDSMPHKSEFARILLGLKVENERLSILENVYSRENRPHPTPNGEIIDAYVQRYCRHLKPCQRRELADFLVDRPGFAKKHENLRMEGGYSSEEVIDITGDVVKTATTEQNEREDLVYSLECPSERFSILEDNLLGEFGLFIPRKKGELIRLNDGMSLLIMDDLKKRRPGQKIAERMYKALTGEERAPWHTKHEGHNNAMYNMFLLGFAHKCLTKAANEGYSDFPENQYKTLTGIPHYRAIFVPLPNTSKTVYEGLMKTVDRDMIEKCGKIIDKFIIYAKGRGDKVVAIGDNKVFENMKNGYMHDFACVGWGLEIEDITYGLAEPKLEIPLQNIKHYVQAYTGMRCLHDEDFRVDVMHGKCDEMLALSDAAALKALSIYASCTRKRVKQMESGEIVPRRNYFIKAMEYMLNNGDFTILEAES